MWKVQRQNPKAKSAKSKGKSTREDVGGGGWGLRGWGGVVRGGHYLCGHREVLLRQGSRPDGGVHRTVSGETKYFFFKMFDTSRGLRGPLVQLIFFRVKEVHDSTLVFRLWSGHVTSGLHANIGQAQNVSIVDVCYIKRFLYCKIRCIFFSPC